MDTKRSEAAVLMLANDALEAAENSAPEASLILIDAAVSILVTCHQGKAARELAIMFGQHMLEQVAAVEAARK